MSLLFTVEDTRTSGTDLIVVGYAPNPDTPLPKKDEWVEVHNPEGSTFQVKVLGVDVTLAVRTCFTQKTVNRAIIIAQGESVSVMPGAEIRGSL